MFFALLLSFCFSWRLTSVAGTNIALGKLVTVSSVDWVFNKEKSCFCRNDALGKDPVPLNDHYGAWTFLLDFRKSIGRQWKDDGNPCLVTKDYMDNGMCSNEYKEAVMDWFKKIYGMGEPDTVLGEPRPKIEFSDAQWEDIFKHFITKVAPQDTFKRASDLGHDFTPDEEKKKEKFYNPNLLQVCRLKDGELVTKTLTDGKKMLEEKLNETHRHEEVKETCFKSKWQKNPWIMVDLEAEVKVDKVMLYNRHDVQGKWDIGNYPVYPDLKNFPKIDNPPWIWDRFDKFQVFVLKKRWRTWDKNKRLEVIRGSEFYLRSTAKKFEWTFDKPFDYWEIAKTKADSQTHIPDYGNKLKNGDIPGAHICETTAEQEKISKKKKIHRMAKWQKEFNDPDGHKQKAWKDFAAKNYPYVVDCKGLEGRYVAVRLLNTGRTEDDETNFMNDSPMTLCEIEVLEKK